MKYNEYKEAKTHGSTEFPLQYYYVDSSHPQYIMPLHWHNETEVVRISEGELTLFVNNEKIEMKKGDVAFIACGALHRGEPKDCSYECAVFSPRLVSGQVGSRLSELVRQSATAGSMLISNPSAAETAREIIDEAREKTPYYELKLASLVSKLFYELSTCRTVSGAQKEGKRNTHRRAVITLLIEHVEKSYCEKITLKDLAAMAGVNEKYLCRFFKEFTGYTPTDYVNRLRVERACYEMKFNHCNVTEAAYECGFNEISYFSKCFKKYKGVSPGKYR